MATTCVPAGDPREGRLMGHTPAKMPTEVTLKMPFAIPIAVLKIQVSHLSWDSRWPSGMPSWGGTWCLPTEGSRQASAELKRLPVNICSRPFRTSIGYLLGNLW
jgi:hypothetical protein